MKSLPDEGSVEWFEQSRRRCVDHLRALLSIRISRDSVAAILQHWGLQSAEYNSALHSSCVISYARLFTNASTKNGNIKYPTKRLIASPGFDRGLHIHVMDLRNRLVAHADYSVFPSTMYLQAVGDERIPLTLGINVKGLFGIESHDLAVRYEKHFSTCHKAVEQMLNLECDELASQARLFPAEFHKTNNIPDAETKTTLDRNLREIPRPTGPAASVENPAFAEGLSGYRYITLTHQVPLIKSGKYVVTEAGIAQEITFHVGAITKLS
jgi:hypothetical protein